MVVGDVLDTSVKYYRLRCGKVGHAGPRTASAPSRSKAAAAAPAAAMLAAPNAAAGGKERFAKNQKELTELVKRRFFYRQAFDIYGGVSGFFTYGPPGAAFKNNLIRLWKQHFVIEENLLEVEDTCIMPHPVLKASGHVDKFNDFMVKDVLDESKFYRADKLLEEVMEKKLEEPDVTEEKRKEYTSVRNQADSYSREEIHEVFQKYGIKSPDSGNDLSEPYEFNLMFPTPIGPGGYLQGYLRPETAQGIFLNYKFCNEQNNNKLPFGVAQVGKAFRNEIAPRGGLTRQREFTQAEIEFFVNPSNKAHPKFRFMADLELTLFHSNEQLAAKEPTRMKIGDAVRDGVVNNETLGYFIARTYAFLVRAGVQPEFVRFRQHLPNEMAHYAADCWDAEIFSSYGWLECVGIADRSAFDLNAHAAAAKVDLTFKEALEKPIQKEVLCITKQSGIKIMKAIGKEGRRVKEYVEGLPQDMLKCLQDDLKNGPKDVDVDGKTFTLKPEDLVFETKMEKTTVNTFTPGVIEPSFGIDRIFASIMEHVYYGRPGEDGDKQTRGVLAFTPIVAPYKCCVLPLDQRIARHDQYLGMLQRFGRELSMLGLPYTVDDSGATIGRRYSRNDELGIPFAMTIDFDTLNDNTVTIRERDSMSQVRMPLCDVPRLLQDMCMGDTAWTEVCARYPS